MIPIYKIILDMTSLIEYIKQWLFHNEHGLVYIAIGSYQQQGTKNNFNQQIPQWLVQFKCDYPSIPILIILIDPEFSHSDKRIKEPLLHDGVYADSWVTHDYINGIGSKWISEHGLEIVTVAEIVNYEYDKSDEINELNIVALLQEIVPQCYYGKLVVVASFTGNNLSMIQPLVSHDEKFMCIDPSSGLNFGCFPDFDRPGTSPVFKIDNKGIHFKTLRDITIPERRRIMSASTNVKLSNDDCSFRLWIEQNYHPLRRLCQNEILLLLRMFDRIDKGNDVEDARANIKLSIDRCLKFDIDSQIKDIIRCIKNSSNVYELLRCVLNCIAQQYGIINHDFDHEINTIISILESEPIKFKLAEHFNRFYTLHFPKLQFL